MSIYDIRLHVLSEGDSFHLADRRPQLLSQRQAAAKLPPANPKAKGQAHEDR